MEQEDLVLEAELEARLCSPKAVLEWDIPVVLVGNILVALEEDSLAALEVDTGQEEDSQVAMVEGILVVLVGDSVLYSDRAIPYE